MANPTEKLPILGQISAEFPAVSKAEWLARIARDLKSKPIGDLDWQIEAGWSVAPFVHHEDFSALPAPLHHRQNNAWELGEDIKIESRNFQQANKTALEALTGGANALRFLMEKTPTEKQLAVLLSSIEVDYITTHFWVQSPSKTPISLLENFKNWAVLQGKSPNILGGGLFHSIFENNPKEIKQTVALINWTAKELPKFKTLTVNGGLFFDGSANCVTELLSIIKIVDAYFNQLTDAGIAAETIASQLQVSIEIGKSYFLEIAKIRALKILLATIFRAYGASVESIFIDAQVSARTQSTAVNQNKIVATTQAMSAVLGGSNRLTIAPSDAISGELSSPFSRRIARNVQHLLAFESYLDQVEDPAAGSYYIEQLTEQLSQRVWQQFQEVA